jgi:hypothetical protein
MRDTVIVERPAVQETLTKRCTEEEGIDERTLVIEKFSELVARHCETFEGTRLPQN